MTYSTEPTSPAGEATQHRLLDAAEVLFAERGYAAANVRDITRQAACNIASVNYHFGGKQRLYEQMFDRLLDHLLEVREAAIGQVMAQAKVKPETLLLRYAEVFLDLDCESKELQRRRLLLFMREVAEPHLPPEVMMAKMIGPTKRLLTDAIGRLYPTMDAMTIELCIHSLVGQLLHVLQARAMYTHAGVTDAAVLDMNVAVDHFVRFSAAALKTLAGKGRS